MSIKALVIGVSDYSNMNQDNLLFCINDISAVSTALIEGLLVRKEYITTLGESGFVSGEDLINALKLMISNIKEEDTFIFYFSGHGGNKSGEHHLLFSDEMVKTQDIIQLLDIINAKNKIIIFDSCMSGNFKVEETAEFKANTSITDFFESGYVVISSSNATQVSWGHPNKPISLFTSFLCEALTDKLLIKKGKKSLYDIQKLLFLYLNIWNRNNPTKVQDPIFRANIGGTIIFSVEDYIPYKVEKYYCETDTYIIYEVEPLNSSIAKRFAVKVILKEPLSFEEISKINHEIVDKVKALKIYKTEKSEQKWKDKIANIVFCYFGRDEFDISNSNYLCHTTWVDETQDKSWWYRLKDKCEIINDIHFNFHTYYATLKIFQEANIGETDLFILQTKEIMSNLISLAEKVIGIYNDFLNGTRAEEHFIHELNQLIPLINKWYFAEAELAIAPQEIKNWCTSYTNLAGTIVEFTLFYNESALATRTFQNRIDCMNLVKSKYYADLEKVRVEEKRIEAILSNTA